MKNFAVMYRFVVKVLAKPFFFFGSLASIVAFIAFFKDKEWAVIVALAFFCVLLLIFTTILIYHLIKITNISNEEFESKTTFIKYETKDAKKIVYELYKLIQCKRPLLTEHDFNFKWTGSKMPSKNDFISEIQDVKFVVDKEDPSEYDFVSLKFKKPIYYNQNELIHLKVNLDDTDQASETFVSNRITKEVDVIQYRIILKHKTDDYSKNARIEKRPVNSMRSAWTKIDEVDFDNDTKCYEYHLIKPEIGNMYRIAWDR